MALSPGRVSVPESARKGEILDIKTLIRHPMETGYRVDRVGKPIPRNIITRMTVTYAGEEVFRMDMTQGVSANPFVAFSTVATESGEIVVTWEDNQGQSIAARRSITVTA